MCNYRNCDELPRPNNGKGRNRKFCNDKCKQMERYYRNKQKQTEGE